MSKSPGPKAVLNEIRGITAALVQHGVADDQNSPYYERLSAEVEIVVCDGARPFSVALKDVPYSEMYRSLRDARSFNLLMLDGALIQIAYEYFGNAVRRHRLAYLPSPDLIQFQNEPEIYLEETWYAEVVEQRVVAVPLRFDFDDRVEVHEPIHHPRSHLTLGQYSRCRIPVTSAVTPLRFMDFVLRNFYNTGFTEMTALLPDYHHRFDESIHHSERRLMHIAGS